MAEYIEREALIEIAEQQGHVSFDDIINEPAADVAPVRHGRWIKRKTWNFNVCSECSFETSPYMSCMNYCPNCGAKMDGGVDDG